jgi:hypothetical protein
MWCMSANRYNKCHHLRSATNLEDGSVSRPQARRLDKLYEIRMGSEESNADSFCRLPKDPTLAMRSTVFGQRD